MTKIAEQLFNQFVAHGVTPQEIVDNGFPNLNRQIEEMRRDEVDNIPLDDMTIINLIWDYAMAEND